MNQNERIVITGLGVVAPNGVGLKAFREALYNGSSGIQFNEELKALNFGCQVVGIPPLSQPTIQAYFTDLQLRNFNSNGIIYGCIAGIQAWQDAGLRVSEETTDYDSGTIFGTGTSGIEKLKESINLIDQGKVKRLGSTAVVQTMASGVSAYLSGMLGLGNMVSTNSAACTTGTEALLLGYERLKLGKAKRMIVGSTCESNPYLWGGFDAMRVTNFKSNNYPEQASRPLSASAAGIVPGSGAGALLIETLSSAMERGARIYAELIGGHVNSGGQRGSGSLTAPNSEAVQRCIKGAIIDAGISASQIDLINGHLTATAKDSVEVFNWTEALGLKGDKFPKIQATKSLIGHCLSASGAIECVATALQVSDGKIHPTINCEDLHPEVLALIDSSAIAQKTTNQKINHAIKASFGFGDVNACVIFKKYSN